MIPFALAVLVISALALVATVFLSGLPLNHDAAMYLRFGERLLAGAVPYVDTVDLNPPLVHYLNAALVAVARPLGIPLVRAFPLTVTLAVAGSTWAVHHALRLARVERDRALLVAAGWLLLSVWIAAANDYGQREHLFALACGPWLLLRDLRHRDAPVPLRFALAVGVGVSPLALLKPQFVFVLAAAEIWLSLRARRTRALAAPETACAMAGGVVYAIHFWLLPPAMSEALFGRWLPQILAHYHVYDAPFAVLFRPKVLAVFAASVLALPLSLALQRRSSERSSERSSAAGLAIGALAACAMYLLQRKGWAYHLYPAVACGALAYGCLFAELRAGRAAPAIVGVGLVCAALVLVPLAFARAVLAWSGPTGQLVELIEAHTAPGESVAVVSSSVTPAYPALVHADRPDATRFPSGFQVPFLYDGVAGPHYRRPADQSAEERRFLAELGQDIDSRRPTLVVIRTDRCQACPPDFRLSEYLQVTGWWSRHLADYRPVGAISGHTVLVRSDE